MPTRTKELPARERILRKAEDLFYRQGYRNTGINQIIAESGVAKATFYANFPSKEDLCITYLRTINEREDEVFTEELARHKSPLARFLCTVELMVPWMEETGYRGCAFLNMIPEVPNPNDRVRKQAAKFYKDYEILVTGLAKELIDSDRKKYGHLKAAELAKEYMTIVAGGISLAALHHSVEPIKNAVKMVRRLVD